MRGRYRLHNDSVAGEPRGNPSERSADTLSSARWIALVLLMLTACSASGAEARDRGGSGTGGDAGSGSGGTDPGTGGIATGGSSGAGAIGGVGAVPGSGGSGGSGSGAIGGAGGIGSGGSSASGGSSNVSFSWTETAPGTGQCRAGRYIGDFAGTFLASPSIALPLPVAGTVDLTLTESQNGEFLDISDGHVSGLANNTFPYESDILGRLNCVTRKLENGFMKNGFYTVGTTNYPFEGPVTADYDTLTYSFVNGTWIAKEPNPAYGGNGTWNAKSCPSGPPC